MILESSAYFLNPWAFPTLISALTVPIITAILLASSRKTKVNQCFLALSIFAGLWLLSYSLMLLSKDSQVAEIWARLAYILVGNTMVMGYVFAIVAVNKFEDRYIWLGFVLSGYVIVSLLVVSTDKIVAGTYEYIWGFFQKHGPWAVFHIGYQLSVGLIVFWEFWNDLRRENISRSRKNRNRGILLAIVILSISSIDFLPAFGVEIYPLGYLPFLGCCMVTAFTIWNFRLVDYTPAFAAEEVLRTLEDPLIVCDPEGRIQLVNQSCVDLTGYEKEDVEGVFVKKIFPDLYETSESLIKNIRNMEKSPEDIQMVSNDGKTIDVNISASQLSDSQGLNVGTIILARDIRDQKQAEQQIEKLEFYHPVTGLPNQKLFYQQIRERIKNDQETDQIHSIFYLSIDGFREIKGALGHENTKKLLEKISNRLETIGGETLVISHWSDNDFIMYYQDINIEKIRERTSQWVREFEDPFEVDDKSLHLTVSMGISVYPKHGRELDELVSKADLAMTRVREVHGQSIKIYEEGRLEETGKKVNLINDLRDVLRKQELQIFYQPRVQNITEKVTGMEALLRWKHTDEGFISPERIITLAEDSGIMGRLGKWILEQSCSQQRNWAKNFDNDLSIAVNISAVQFYQQQQFLNSIESILEETDMNPNNLEIEITETTAMKDIEFSKDILSKIKRKGVKVSIDDFGTGHSSMKYLMELPIDGIKIDKSFVLNMTNNPENKALIKTMVSMSRELDLTVIAEGVETREHKEFLSSLGCDYFQGFLWAEPMSAEESSVFLEEQDGIENLESSR